jgi:hypothetical protein
VSWWNIFNKQGKYVGEVEANDKETAQRFSTELYGYQDVDLQRPKFNLFRIFTKKERDCGVDKRN